MLCLLNMCIWLLLWAVLLVIAWTWQFLLLNMSWTERLTSPFFFFLSKYYHMTSHHKVLSLLLTKSIPRGTSCSWERWSDVLLWCLCGRISRLFQTQTVFPFALAWGSLSNIANDSSQGSVVKYHQGIRQWKDDDFFTNSGFSIIRNKSISSKDLELSVLWYIAILLSLLVFSV